MFGTIAGWVERGIGWRQRQRRAAALGAARAVQFAHDLDTLLARLAPDAEREVEELNASLAARGALFSGGAVIGRARIYVRHLNVAADEYTKAMRSLDPLDTRLLDGEWWLDSDLPIHLSVASQEILKRWSANASQEI